MRRFYFHCPESHCRTRMRLVEEDAPWRYYECPECGTAVSFHADRNFFRQGWPQWLINQQRTQTVS